MIAQISKVLLQARHLLGPALAVIVWHVAATSGDATRNTYLPAPLDVLSALSESTANGILPQALAETLVHFAIGYSLAAAGGIVTGIVLGRFSLLADATYPLLYFLRTLPGVAILPIAIFMVGLNATAVSLVTAFAAYWFVLLNTVAGVGQTHPVLVDTARTFNVHGPRFVSSVVLPSALPQIITGLRTALGIAVVVAVSVETIIGRDGIGGFVRRSQGSLQPARAYAGIVVIGLTAMALYRLASFLHKRLVPWARSSSL